MRPGDILVLVRQRGALFEAVIRALKNEGIAVAGADRLVLTEHIAVMDLMALADALLLPDDDLALATVLKSPLFGLTEEQLFALAWDRKGSLRAALRAKAARARRRGSTRCARRRARADAVRVLRAAARRRQGGRKRFLCAARAGGRRRARRIPRPRARLRARARRRRCKASSPGCAPAQREVKRDMEIARDEVRVMTVHGAKGLEAPIVILADTTTPPQGRAASRACCTLPARTRRPARRTGWCGPDARRDDTAPIAAARAPRCAAAENEYRRLLYVAMTRAADRLVVCGRAARTRMPAGCWYELVERRRSKPDCGRGAGRRSATARCCAVARSPPETARASPAAASAPSAAAAAAGLAARRTRRRSRARRADQPSRASITRIGDGRREAGAQALARGNIVHRLMQSLPDIPPERRAEAARRTSRAQRRTSPTPSATRSPTQVLALLDDPRFAALFAPGSRAEVPIVGRCRTAGESPAGVVDRLVVTAERGADRRLQDQPPGAAEPRRDSAPDYSRSSRSIAPCCAQLYPDRPVRAALVWTDVPDLMEIPADALDAARWPRLTHRRDRALTLRARRSYVPALPGARCRPQFEITRCSMAVGKVSDANFEAEVLKATEPGGGRFLGRMVRPLPHDRAGAGRDRGRDGRQGQDREAQRRREPGDAPRSTASCRSRR